MNTPLIVSLLLRPATAASLSPLDWELAIRQARAANLIARLAHVLEGSRQRDHVPPDAAMHLLAADLVAERQRAMVDWEVRCIREAVPPAVPVVLLKGAAYTLLGLEAGRGRLFSDVDILVPRERLAEVERALVEHGWTVAEMDAYDDEYYRRWMHELPPMRHERRGTHIDVHHAILPDTARVRVDNAALMQRTVPVPGHDGVLALDALGLLLHSASHLFHEGELDNGLRDLFDLDALARQALATPAGLAEAGRRAASLGLARPWFYAVRYMTMLLGTPLPAHVHANARPGQPSAAVLRLMDACYRRALRPPHATCSTAGTAAALLLLYVRSHWLRMPMHLLIPHLARKLWRRWFEKPTASVEPGVDGANGAAKTQIPP